ncbi:MAG: glycoside hydrolase family 9 protein [Alphaproteobacteria bacterium]|nr:glycoside hydrolase family 9 protein [Alphaproteobacteria bacterium]MBU2380157.1 glycoside hydrolase family 9 protein [Alphaproteobacteria bacterium]
MGQERGAGRFALSIAAVMLAAVPAVAQDHPLQTLRLNQVGFETEGPKAATLADPRTTPLPWTVADETGAIVLSGDTTVTGLDATSGDHVHTIRFDAVRTSGDLILTVGGQRRTVHVSASPFADLKRDAMVFFYENRSGVPIEAEHVARADLARPAGHAPDRATCFSGEDMRGNVWSGCDYTLDVTGGWYDAGDHGKYVVNGGISAWTLLNAWERAATQRFAEPYPDGSADIPEAGNGVSDLLDEARIEVEFLLAMQIPEGARLRVPVGRFARDQALTFTEIDAGGLVHHKVHDVRWTALPMAPADDPETRYLYPPNTAATLNMVAVAAQAARIWKTIDPAFSARALAAGRRGLAAARRHPDIYALGDFNGGGGYGDDDLSDEFYWAMAEMFVTTDDPALLTELKASPLYLTAPGMSGRAGADIGWNSVGALGTISLALADDRLPDADRNRARGALVASARTYLADAQTQGYGHPFAGPDYSWGSNGNLMNRAMVLGLAHDFTDETGFRNGVVSALDYLLGRNPLDQSYVTGYGDRPMVNPHHRFWAHSADPAYPKPPSGVLSGGPNNTNMSDPVAQTMRGNCLPQKCWKDDIRAFTQNEVAVNWNAPFVWVAAFLSPD